VGELAHELDGEGHAHEGSGEEHIAVGEAEADEEGHAVVGEAAVKAQDERGKLGEEVARVGESSEAGSKRMAAREICAWRRGSATR
jgi:hypothetical protein